MKQNKNILKKLIEEYDRQVTNVYRKSCRAISMEIAERSPVKTGRLLGSWAPSVNRMKSHYFPGNPEEGDMFEPAFTSWARNQANRSKAMENLTPRIDSATNSMKKSSTYYFTNNTPYIRQAEYDGWIRTGPYRMVATSIINWKDIVNTAATNG
jgi:hypothetical protein